MRRRSFITLIGGAVVWPLSARAQQPALPLIGVLSSTSEQGYRPFIHAVFQGLNEQGFSPGKNIAVEYRWADGKYEVLPNFANDLVHIPVRIIVAIAPLPQRLPKLPHRLFRLFSQALPIPWPNGSNR